jgi:hypothetical protein
MKTLTFRVLRNLLVASFILGGLTGWAQDVKFDRYHRPDEIPGLMRSFVRAHPGQVKVMNLATTYGGADYQIMKVDPDGRKDTLPRPSVLVAANFSGTSPLATEGALYLIRELLAQPEKGGHLTWYILASANPDGAVCFFRKPLVADGRNARPWNDDMDEQTDEDGPDDLNGDGYITQMRVKDPDGTLIPDSKDPRLMKKADPLKGEKGIYKVYTEGIDNDGDGQYNEDGPGGTEIGITFPFLYGYNKPGTGAWSGSEPEVYSVMKFMTDHPEIAMTMTYGQTNFCLVPPKGGRKTEVNANAIKLPGRLARRLNADPDKTYTMQEVKDLLSAIVPPGTKVDDAMVASMLDQGAVVNPPAGDARWYKSLADKYKKYLKGKGWTEKRLDPGREQDGTFELWSYYQLGLPTFSMDLWALPKPKDSLKNAFLAFNDSILGGKGFVPWTEVSHPVFGKVEVGGNIPFADRVPPPTAIDSLLRVQVPWVFELVRMIPKLEIDTVRTENLGAGVYRVDAWIRNPMEMSFPLEIGERTKVVPPAIVTLTGKGIRFLSGRERVPVESVGALDATKLTWIVEAAKAPEVTIRVAPVNAFGSEKTIRLGGK